MVIDLQLEIKKLNYKLTRRKEKRDQEKKLLQQAQGKENKLTENNHQLQKQLTKSNDKNSKFKTETTKLHAEAAQRELIIEQFRKEIEEARQGFDSLSQTSLKEKKELNRQIGTISAQVVEL